MPQAVQTPAERESRREEILDAALALLADGGLAAVTMRAIAARVGCSAMTPYGYFPDRAAILAGLRDAAFLRFAAALRAAAQGADEPLERLSGIGQAYVAFARRETPAYRLMFELERPSEMTAAGRAAWDEIHAAIAFAVAKGVLAGDTATLSHIFWSGMHGLCALHIAGRLQAGRTLDELIDPLMLALVAGTHAGSQDEETRRPHGKEKHDAQ